MQIIIAKRKDVKTISNLYPYTKQYITRRGVLYLAKEDDRFIGCAFVVKRKAKGTLKLENLILIIETFNENDRCRGIASKLVETIKKDSKATGVYRVIAYFQDENLASRRIWIKAGFNIVENESNGCTAEYVFSK